MMSTMTGDFHVLKRVSETKLKKLQGEDCSERSEQDGQGRWGNLNILQTIQTEHQNKYSSSIPETKLYSISNNFNKRGRVRAYDQLET